MSPVMGHVMQQGGFMDEKIRIYMVVRKNCEKETVIVLRPSTGQIHLLPPFWGLHHCTHTYAPYPP
jgi:hypothetical protein